MEPPVSLRITGSSALRLGEGVAPALPINRGVWRASSIHHGGAPELSSLPQKGPEGREEHGERRRRNRPLDSNFRQGKRVSATYQTCHVKTATSCFFRQRGFCDNSLLSPTGRDEGQFAVGLWRTRRKQMTKPVETRNNLKEKPLIIRLLGSNQSDYYFPFANDVQSSVLHIFYHTTWVPHYETLLPVTRENIVPRYLIGCRANGDMQLRDTEGRIFNDVSLCSACVLTEDVFSRVAKLEEMGMLRKKGVI
ncbi:hypothetical protein CEXT_762061 [Caerostris extrusa]|uniref:Uncharacterized protein n=1 Tax=Caerostris extrusa TaxID=172846 RepID=A0AAV4SQB3_CAEEX|nr:hypothetical protein CEXT_762061 [Caerostris extrusa]